MGRKRHWPERRALRIRSEQEQHAEQQAADLETRMRLEKPVNHAVRFSYITQAAGMLVAYATQQDFSQELHSVRSTAGFAVWILGAAAGMYTQRALLPTHNRGELLTNGMYSILRHPIYAYFRISSVGAVLMYPSLETMLPAAAVFASTEMAARIEERRLAAKFGDQYRVYAAKVHRWMPGLQYKRT